MASRGCFPYVAYIRSWQIAKYEEITRALANITIPMISSR